MKGLEAASMADLAQASGISEEQLLKDYKTTQGVLRAAITWYFNKYSRMLNAEMAMHADLYAAMEALLRSVIDLCFDLQASNRKHSLRTIFELSLQDEQYRASFEEMFGVWTENVHEKVAQFSSDLKDPSETEVLTHYVLAVMEGLYDLIRYGAQKEMMHQVVDMSLIVIAAKMKPAGKATKQD